MPDTKPGRIGWELLLPGREPHGAALPAALVDAERLLDRPLLLYAGSCPKCRMISWLVVVLSLGTIRRMPLEKPQWQKFYTDDFPQARGYPVLFVAGKAIHGPRVFFAVPLVIVRSWLALLGSLRPGWRGGRSSKGSS